MLNFKICEQIKILAILKKPQKRILENTGQPLTKLSQTLDAGNTQYTDLI